MSGLDDIRVRVEGGDGEPGIAAGIGNAPALLQEIATLLEELVATGEGASIDLRAMPLAPGDREKLEEALGSGEITAELAALGRSTVRETAIGGIWWVTHLNPEDEVVAEFIEVAYFPDILSATEQDAGEGAARLRGALEEDSDDAGGGESDE